MPNLKLKLLGGFELRDDADSALDVRGKKLRGLIAYLALNPDQRHGREKLATLLWGDRFDTQARQSLRQALLELRKLIGDHAPDALQIDDEAIVFVAGSVVVDAVEFDRLHGDGNLAAAAAAYGGDLLDGLSIRSEPFDAWLAGERARFHDLACEVWEGLSRQQLRAGDPEAAVESGKRLVALDGLRESGHRALMGALAGAGRRSEAIQQYHVLAHALRAELDVEPDAATLALFETIRDSESVTDLATEVAVPDQAAPASPPRRWRWAAVAAAVMVVFGGMTYWNSQLRDPGPTTTGDATALLALADKPSIAVLPFNNLSGDEEQNYFADGITEDIITGLSKFGLFFVISRNSTFAYKGGDVNVTDVARDLGARYVLEGSVRKSGNRVRITAQLIDAVEDRHIWAERYDRDLDDVFEVQDEITQSIITAVAPEYLTAEMRRAQRKETRNLDAWDSFMRGYWHFMRFTKDDNATAQGLLRQAIAQDSRHSNYRALLAVTHVMEGFYGWGASRDESFRVALENAESALAMDDQDALALRAIGLVHFFSKNHDMALTYYRRAVDANPNEAENRALLGAALGVAGDYSGALEQFEAAMNLSPRDIHVATWYNYLGVAAFVAGRDGEAAEWAMKTVQANPAFPAGYRTLAASLGNLEQLPEAIAAREKLQALLPDLTIAQLRESLPYFKDPAMLEHYLDGLRNAGLPE